VEIAVAALGTVYVIETGSWKWMAVTFAYMLALAYAASLATYNIGGEPRPDLSASGRSGAEIML
jgi:hypothetical protein